MIVSNIGVVHDFSSLYTTNAGPYTATIQAQLKDDHKVGSFEYMDRVRERSRHGVIPMSARSSRAARWWTPFSTSGMPAPIDVQVSSRDLDQDLRARAGSGRAHPQDCRASARSTFRRT